mmetsp:Transcript_2606/g.4468  ORF Transcript_2606/g.4468 Transcript_2606/m.4468 type:complete len:99 (-) Transcript_2606:321-617(-)
MVDVKTGFGQVELAGCRAQHDISWNIAGVCLGLDARIAHNNAILHQALRHSRERLQQAGMPKQRRIDDGIFTEQEALITLRSMTQVCTSTLSATSSSH